MRRPLLVVLAGAVVGALVGLLVAVLQDEVYVADGSIAIARQGAAPGSDPAFAAAAEAAAELFASRAVAESVVANLRLDDTPEELLDRVDLTSEPDSSLVRLQVEADDPEAARRTAQNLAEVATVLFNDRFGPETSASVWEAARAGDEPVSPQPLRNVVLGALAGMLAGLLIVAWRERGRLPSTRRESSDPETPSSLEARIAEVTRRELELARRAGALALRERMADGVAAGASPAPAPQPGSAPALVSAAADDLVAPTGPFVEPRLGEWTVADVELLLAEHGDAFPELREELGFYLESFRDVTLPDGRLPGGVEAVLEDVFGPLLVRARSTHA